MDKFIQFSAILAATIVAVQSAKWKDCGSKDGTVANVRVTDCDSSTICNLKKGQNYTISVDFTSKAEIKQATAVVHGILAGIPVPFPINNPNGCKDSGLTCPLKSGAKEAYHSQIHVASEYPKVKVIVKWELKDANNDIFCVEIGAKIVDGDKKQQRKSANHLDTNLRFKPKH